MTFGDLVEDLMLLNSRLQVTHQHLGDIYESDAVRYLYRRPLIRKREGGGQIATDQ
jgi:hypothetical protein